MTHNQRRSSDEVGSVSSVGDHRRCGIGLLGMWLARGGMRQKDQPGARIRAPLIFTTSWPPAASSCGIVYVITDTDAIAWAAFAIVAVVAGLGFAMLAVWLQRRRRLAAAGPAADARPSSTSQPPSVTFHGIVAATTLVTVVRRGPVLR